jgi:hypothetical protein
MICSSLLRRGQLRLSPTVRTIRHPTMPVVRPLATLQSMCRSPPPLATGNVSGICIRYSINHAHHPAVHAPRPSFACSIGESNGVIVSTSAISAGTPLPLVVGKFMCACAVGKSGLHCEPLRVRERCGSRVGTVRPKLGASFPRRTNVITHRFMHTIEVAPVYVHCVPRSADAPLSLACFEGINARLELGDIVQPIVPPIVSRTDFEVCSSSPFLLTYLAYPTFLTAPLSHARSATRRSHTWLRPPRSAPASIRAARHAQAHTHAPHFSPPPSGNLRG